MFLGDKHPEKRYQFPYDGVSVYKMDSRRPYWCGQLQHTTTSVYMIVYNKSCTGLILFRTIPDKAIRFGTLSLKFKFYFMKELSVFCHIMGTACKESERNIKL